MATSGDGNVLDPAKYTFENAGTKYVPVDLRVSGDSKSVIATFDVTISGIPLDYKVRLVKDVAGNYISPLEVTGTVATNANVTTGIKDAVATGTKTVVLEFDRALQSLDANDFIIKTGTSPVVNNKIVTATLSTDGTKATLTLEDKLPENGVNVTYETIPSPNSQDLLGGKLTANGSTTVADEISASLALDANGELDVRATGTTGAEFTLSFNENVEAKAGLHAFITVKDAAGNNLAVSTAVANGTGKDLVITLSKPVVGGTATIAIKENPLLVDHVGNNAEEIETVQVDGIADTLAASVTTQLPQADTLTANGTHVLAFSEALNAASKLAVKTAVDAKFVAGGTATATSAWNAAGDTLTVTIAGADALGTNQVVLSAIADIAVTDVAGNTSAALQIQTP